MPEKGELQVLPLVITPCDLGTKLARPVVLKYQALDWQTISFDVPREKLIIAGLYVLVRRGKFPLPSLRQYLPSRQPKDATQPTAAKLGHCKFGFQDV
jgi:hypothetical protein